MTDAVTRPSDARADGYGDPTTGPFWDAAWRHELRMPQCDDCGRIEWYPRPFCRGCGGSRMTWATLSGDGVIHSQVVVRIPVRDDLDPPYIVALVDLAEGPRFLATVEATPGETAIGDRVRVAWRDRSPDPPLPVFVPAGGPPDDAARRA